MYIRRYRGSRERILAKKQYRALGDVSPFKTINDRFGNSRFYHLKDDLNIHVYIRFHGDGHERFCFSSDNIDRKKGEAETFEYLKRRSDYILSKLNLTLADTIED